jgi:hypothetical protein
MSAMSEIRPRESCERRCKYKRQCNNYATHRQFILQRCEVRLPGSYDALPDLRTMRNIRVLEVLMQE